MQEGLKQNHDVVEWCCPTVEASCLLAVSPGNAGCLPSSPLTGIEMVDQTEGLADSAHESRQQKSILQRIPFCLHLPQLCPE